MRAAGIMLAGLVGCCTALDVRGDMPLRRPFVMQRNMPYGTITAIEPAGRYTWFGGREMRPGEEHGIARYDRLRHRWDLFLESEGIVADDISAFAVDGDYLWIGSITDRLWNRGFYRYHPPTHTARRFQEEDGLPFWRVRDIAVLDDAVWAATMGGVARFSRQDGAWHAFTRADGAIADDFTLSLAVDPRHIWVGTFSGLERYDRRHDTWQRYGTHNSPLTGGVTDMAADRDSIWMLAPQRVFRYRIDAERFELFPITHPPAVGVDFTVMAATDDSLWLGSTNGLFELDRRRDAWHTHTEAQGMVHRSVQTLAVDDEMVWAVDPRGLGVSAFDRRSRRWRRYHYREGSPANHIYSILLQGDNLYVGTLGSGFWMYRTDRDEWVNRNMDFRLEGRTVQYMGHQSPTMYTDIVDMASDGERIWLATNHGLCVHDPDDTVDFEVIAAERFPMQCVAVFDGHVWCGGQEGGLRLYEPLAGMWTDISETLGRQGRVTAIATEADAAYVAVEDRIYRFSGTNRQPDIIALDLENWIKALLIRDERLWIGTLSGLYVHESATGQTRRIDDDRLPDPVIHALAYVQGRYWIGTEEGVAVCDHPDGEWRTYTAPDVLTYPLVSAITGDALHVWVATLGGGMVRLRF